MNNIQRIFFFQYVPVYINQELQRIRNFIFHKSGNDHSTIENIDHFKSVGLKNKRALISLSPSAWHRALNEYPNIKIFNYVGLTFEMIKALNENEYVVDIIELGSDFIPKKKYDLYIGHGGRCKTIIDSLQPTTKIVQYVSGSYWVLFNQESEQRYSAFRQRKNVKEDLTFRRSLEGLVEGEQYLTKRAHVLFTINCPRMVESFGEHKNKFFFTGFGAYLDQNLLVDQKEKDFEAGRRNFIYVGGTGGNIQKGLDILLETFNRIPELNLFIYCKVEEEILKYYKTELKAKNIHYIYHWRVGAFRKKLRDVLKKVNFTVHAPINTGLGTAFMGSMSTGLIPVGYIDLVADKESSVISNLWDIDSMVECVSEASGKSAEWCRKASELTRKNSQENWSVDNFRRKFREMILQIN